MMINQYVIDMSLNEKRGGGGGGGSCREWTVREQHSSQLNKKTKAKVRELLCQSE